MKREQWELGLSDDTASFVNSGARCICKCDGPAHSANAALIVRAVNSYEALTAACEALLGSHIYADAEGLYYVETGGYDDDDHRKIVAQARAALALAKGE